MICRTSPEVGGMGHSIKRKEDLRFIQGKGNYVDDVNLPEMLYGHMVRSPYAHARLKSVNTENAMKLPGVLAVITGEDLAKANLAWMPTLFFDKQMVLATGKVLFQSQEVAFVVAEDPYIAADAAELVEVDYEELPVLVDPHKALDPTRPSCAKTAKKRAITSFTGRWATEPPPIKSFADAAVKAKVHAVFQRCHPSPLETCGCVADHNPATGRLTIYLTSQAPHAHRTLFSLGRRHPGKQHSCHLPGHRRRFRQQGSHLSRIRLRRRRISDSRPPGEVDRNAFRESPIDWLRARLPHDRRARCHKRRQDPGNARQDSGRPWSLQRSRATHQVSRRIIQHLHRRLRLPYCFLRSRRGLYEQGAWRHRLSLFLPCDRSCLSHRESRRCSRSGTQDRSRRIAEEELHRPEEIPLQVTPRLVLRQRKLRRCNEDSSRHHRLRRTEEGAGRETQEGRADGHRNLQLRRSRRRRACPYLRYCRHQDVRQRRDSRSSYRQSYVPHGDKEPGSGT